MDRALAVAIYDAATPWCKFIARKHRDYQATAAQIEREARMAAQPKITTLAACHQVIEEAYAEVSDNGTLPANARQMMYAVRRRVLAMGLEWYKQSKSFTGNVLPDYVRDHAPDWNIVYDARGHLVEPYDGEQVSLGTLDARDYIDGWETTLGDLRPKIEATIQFKTAEPEMRYAAVLFIEKEGFDPLIQAADIRNRYGIATMSTKGLPVTAARELVDRFTEREVPVFVLRDFDIAGFNIAKTLTTDNRRHTYDTEPLVYDLGLRLADALEMGLEDEDFAIKQNVHPRDNLEQGGATEDEIEYLVREQKGKHWHGKRIELNAMTSRQFIDFLETKLEEHGIEPVVADTATLGLVWQQEQLRRRVEAAVLEAAAKVTNEVEAPPADLEARVRAYVEEHAVSWLAAVGKMD
jgi:hypothetical protein